MTYSIIRSGREVALIICGDLEPSNALPQLKILGFDGVPVGNLAHPSKTEELLIVEVADPPNIKWMEQYLPA